MAKQKIITFQEALNQEKIKKNDFFLIRYPDGKNKLFRLVDKAIAGGSWCCTRVGTMHLINSGCTGNYVLWGPPTDEKICINGRKGFDNIDVYANSQVEKEYSFPGVFRNVYACGLPQEEYEAIAALDMSRILGDADKLYSKHPNDRKFEYALASTCINYPQGIGPFRLQIFIMSRGRCTSVNLYVSKTDTSYNRSFPVRPEAIPEPTMKLLIKGCDGTEEKPWICLGNEGKM